MGIVITTDHDHHRLRASAEGTVTLGDVLTHLEQERLEAGLSRCELIDARGATPAFSPGEVRSIVEALRRLARESRLGPTAIVADNDIGYGLLRMLEMLVEDVCAVRPFRRVEEAEQWLATVCGSTHAGPGGSR